MQPLARSRAHRPPLRLSEILDTAALVFPVQERHRRVLFRVAGGERAQLVYIPNEICRARWALALEGCAYVARVPPLVQLRLKEQVILEFKIERVQLPRRECPVGLLVDGPRMPANRAAADHDEEAAVREAAVTWARGRVVHLAILDCRRAIVHDLEKLRALRWQSMSTITVERDGDHHWREGGEVDVATQAIEPTKPHRIMHANVGMHKDHSIRERIVALSDVACKHSRLPRLARPRILAGRLLSS